MPPITRPQGVSIGNIGQVSRVSPRAEPTGPGGILQKAAAAEFSAAQQVADTAGQMRDFGVAQTAFGIDLMKPFKAIKNSRETLAAEDIAINAQLSLRGMSNTMMSSGATPDTWGETFNTEFTKTQNAALVEAQKISPAAVEHVYKKLQQERLELFTDVLKKAEGANIEEQMGMLERKEDFELQEAASARDPLKRLAHEQSYMKTLERMEFKRAITPAVRQQKEQSFRKRLLESTVVQYAQEKGLPDALTMIDALSADEVQKESLRDKAKHAIRFKVADTKAREDQIEKQQKIDQDTLFTDARTKVSQNSDPQTIMNLYNKIPDYVRSGVLRGEQGDQLITHINKRLDDLAKTNPEETDDAVERIVHYRIVMNPNSVTQDYILNQVGGLSTSTRVRLSALQIARMAETHYRHLSTYKNNMGLFRSLAKGETETEPDLLDGSTGASGLSEDVARAVIIYDQLVDEVQAIVKQPLTNQDLMKLEPEVEKLVKSIKEKKYSDAGGKAPSEVFK